MLITYAVDALNKWMVKIYEVAAMLDFIKEWQKDQSLLITYAVDEWNKLMVKIVVVAAILDFIKKRPKDILSIHVFSLTFSVMAENLYCKHSLCWKYLKK